MNVFGKWLFIYRTTLSKNRKTKKRRMSFQDVGRKGRSRRPAVTNRNAHYEQNIISPSHSNVQTSTVPETSLMGDSRGMYAQASDNILQYQVRRVRDMLIDFEDCSLYSIPMVMVVRDRSKDFPFSLFINETSLYCRIFYLKIKKNVGLLENMSRQVGTNADGPVLETQ